MLRKGILVVVICILVTTICLSACQNKARPIYPTKTPLRLITLATPNIDCASAMKQGEMNFCMWQRAQAKYAKLNSLIAELGKHMGTFRYLTLLQNEADWEKTAQAHCKWLASFFEGGSVQPLQHQGCLVEQYQQRIEVLRMMLCEGAGMTGECEASLRYQE
jgi:uncharacterized protein YecT (DUF1311 family)